MGLSISANLTKSFRKLVKEIEGSNEEVVHKTIVNTHNAIQTISPIDKGIYVASNFVKADRAGNEVATSPDERSERSAEADAVVPEIKNGKKFYFYNNLSYALGLEAGRSQQAPSGVYSVAADRVAEFIAKNAKGYKKIKWRVVK